MHSFKSKIIAGAALLLTAGLAHAEDTIRLGMTPEPYMPFTEVNASGEWEGLEADLSRAVCAKLPVKCEIKQMAWDGLIPSLNEKKVDFIIGAFSITDDRRKVVDFSTPYYTEGTSFVGAKSDSTKITTVDAPDGSGKIIGVQTSGVQAAYVAKYLKGAEAKSYDTADNSVADLVAGRVDYVLIPDLYIQTFLKTAAGADYEVKLTVPKNTTLGEGVAYAIRKGDADTLTKINTALAELDKDGTTQKLVDKWIFDKK